MHSNKDFSDLFDENFEVTYDEEPGISPDYSQSGDKGGRSGDSGYGRRTESIDENYDNRENDFNDYSGGYTSGYRNDEDDYDDDYSGSSSGKAARRNRRRGGVHLAAPIQKGGRTLSRISGIIIRQLSLILILAISAYVTYTFWRASVPYGDISESIRQSSFSHTLLAYICVMAVFLFFELISFFWSMTKVRVRDAGGSWKEDTGRGLTSFILVFAASYLAFLFNRFVPSSPDVLYGLKGALLVYGSMHNTLLGLCAAGVISCLVRKYMAR